MIVDVACQIREPVLRHARAEELRPGSCGDEGTHHMRADETATPDDKDALAAQIGSVRG